MSSAKRIKQEDATNAGAVLEEEEEDDDIDLYGDLDKDMQENTTTAELRARAVAAETALADQKKDLLLHKKKLQVLAKQNVALKRNISCLYKTAKAELDRKNEDIKDLRRKLNIPGGTKAGTWSAGNPNNPAGVQPDASAGGAHAPY